MVKAMIDEEDRSGEAAAGRIPEEFMKVAEKDCLNEIGQAWQQK